MVTYLPYSLLNTDTELLYQKQEEYNYFSAEIQSQFSGTSMCTWSRRPEVSCIENRCKCQETRWCHELKESSDN